MEIKELGKVAFIDRLTKDFEKNNQNSLRNFSEDCLIIPSGENFSLVTTDLLLEGVHFDLIYTPLKHLGYKAVVVAISDIIAMNGTAENLLIGLGISSRFSVENVEELYSGIKIACDQYNVALCGGDTTASVNGLTISVTATGSVQKDKIVYRNGAKPNDLICITGDLGAAYLGFSLLEREKSVLDGNNIAKPKFDGYDYQLQRALKPNCRVDIIKKLEENSILPTSMIDISEGLASELLHICRESSCGAKIFLDKIPIASSSFSLADELKVDSVVAALNGGDDYELMFTVPIDKFDTIRTIQGIDIIGHISSEDSVSLVTPDGAEISIQAPSWTQQTNE